ncbi:InlB B-repeat-containing protein, partial [Ruminococcus bromii]|uniref:InlB B-repeat-containing protein n=1 Tax=Ruminococcus bromii TaxID=40518 RepID=UPI003C6E259D
MKTKISHLGRSTVSVVLAVMMLLSTMLIGTVSTVNAVTKTFEAVNLVGNINGNTKWDSTEYPFTFDETTGYWYLDITITQSSEFKARVNNGWDISFGASGGDNYTISESEIGDYRISVKDGSDNNTDLTVQKTVKKVADSVALTANPTSVKVGNSVTLTPTVSGAKSDNLTYTYKKTSDGTATEEKNADNSLTVTPTVAGTYKYTVTVSADGYSPVTSNEISFTATDSVKYYICGRFNTTWHDPSVDDPQFVEDESNPGLFYYETGKTIADLSGTISETYGDTPKYFYIYKTATNESTNYLTTSDNAGHNFQNNTVDRPLALSNKTGTDEKYLVRFNDDKDTSTTPVTIWLDTRNNEYKLWYTTALSHIVNVAEGVSATVDKATATTGEKVTVTAIPENGKVLDKVTVVGEDGSTPIETTVSGNTATFTMPDQNVTVTGVTFREANKYTVTFSSSDNTFGTVSATNGTTPLTSPATVTEGDTVTFTAKPKDGYALSGWTVNDASVSSTAKQYAITIDSDTTVVANFKEVTGTLSKYYLLCGTGATFKADSYTHVPLYTNEDGVFYADFDVAKDSIPKSKDYFIIFSTKEDTSGIIVDSNNVTVNAFN